MRIIQENHVKQSERKPLKRRVREFAAMLMVGAALAGAPTITASTNLNAAEVNVGSGLREAAERLKIGKMNNTENKRNTTGIVLVERKKDNTWKEIFGFAAVIAIIIYVFQIIKNDGLHTGFRGFIHDWADKVWTRIKIFAVDALIFVRDVFKKSKKT